MRREFSKKIREEAYERSGGICECHLLAKAGLSSFSADGCGARLGPGNVFYEHIVQAELGGEPTLENCAALSKTCWRLKTAKIDQPVVAKTMRQKQRGIGIGRRNGPPMAGSKGSPWKRGFNKPAERRV